MCGSNCVSDLHSVHEGEAQYFSFKSREEKEGSFYNQINELLKEKIVGNG